MNFIRSRLLGIGREAFVSKATLVGNDSHDSFDVAVKSVEISCAKSLEKERQLYSQFEGCPSILRCYGADTTEEEGLILYNIWLEYASGGSLADRIRSSPAGLPEYEVRHYTESILLGLAHMHRRCFVHCDIKPHNILLVSAEDADCEWIAKIADLEFAMKVGKTNGIKGIVMYLAPESVRHQEYLIHSDIWAVGCTVLEMLTGKAAWWNSDELNTSQSTLLGIIGFTDKVPEIPSWLSEEAKDFLSKCLLKDPCERYTSEELLSHPFVLSRQRDDASASASIVVTVPPPVITKKIHVRSSSVH